MWHYTTSYFDGSAMQRENGVHDVPFIPQPDSLPLIIYHAGNLPELSIEGGNKIRLVKMKHALYRECERSTSDEIPHFI